MKITRNLNPLGPWNALAFGLCNIADGLVRVFTLGYFFSSFSLDHTRNSCRKNFDRLKAHQENKA